MKYSYNGARSLVLMHEKFMMLFLETWMEAKKSDITLPATDNKNYESLDTLLSHLLRSARSYMIWICEKLDLPDPGIMEIPAINVVESETHNYLSHLFERWRLPLADVPYEKFHDAEFTSWWGVNYCIDAMLEHAVMHPIRHELQLQNLILEQQK